MISPESSACSTTLPPATAAPAGCASWYEPLDFAVTWVIAFTVPEVDASAPTVPPEKARPATVALKSFTVNDCDTEIEPAEVFVWS